MRGKKDSGRRFSGVSCVSGHLKRFPSKRPPRRSRRRGDRIRPTPRHRHVLRRGLQRRWLRAADTARGGKKCGAPGIETMMLSSLDADLPTTGGELPRRGPLRSRANGGRSCRSMIWLPSHDNEYGCRLDLAAGRRGHCRREESRCGSGTWHMAQNAIPRTTAARHSTSPSTGVAQARWMSV